MFSVLSGHGRVGQSSISCFLYSLAMGVLARVAFDVVLSGHGRVGQSSI